MQLVDVRVPQLVLAKQRESWNRECREEHCVKEVMEALEMLIMEFVSDFFEVITDLLPRRRRI